MTNPKTLAAIRAISQARRRHTETIAELQRIGRPMSMALPDTNSTAAAVEAAERQLQDIMAAHALGEAETAAIESAQSALAEAEKNHQAAEGAAERMTGLAEGLQRRLQEAHAAETDARRAVAEAEASWMQAEMEAAEDRYIRHANALISEYTRMRSIATVLSRRGIRPANATSLALMPQIPSVGPQSATIIAKRSNGREHGIAQWLYAPSVRNINFNPEAIEQELFLLSDSNTPVAA